MFRVVRPDGTLAAEQRANVETDGIQHEARVTATTDGFVIVWTDAVERSDDLLTGVRARRFSSAGAAMGGEILVATSRTDREERPAVAANGDEWLVVWQRTQLGIGGGTTAYLRRFSGSTPLDATDIQAGPERGRAFVVTALESGDWAAAWFETSDVYARVIDDASPAFDPADTLAVAAEPGHPERHQMIAPLEGGDFLVAWEDGDGPSHIAFSSSPGAMLAPEAMDLAMRLEDGESHVSVAASPDGVWLVWSGFEWGTGGLGLSAYHLPID